MVSLCTQLHLVLLKNLRYKLRNARDTFAEILMPCVFALLLSIIFTNTTSTSTIPAATNPSKHDVATFTQIELAMRSDGCVYYAPATNTTSTEVNLIMNSMRNKLPQDVQSQLIPMRSETDMIALYNSQQGISLPTSQTFMAGIIFPTPDPLTGKLPLDAQIRLRYNGSNIPDTSMFFQPSRWRTSGGELSNFNSEYEWSGFLAIQSFVTQTLMSLRGNRTSAVDISLSQYPFHSYTTSNNEFIDNLAPMFIVIGFVNVVGKTAAGMVFEKETKTKEAMKMMGLSTVVWWSGWWLTTALSVLISSFLITLIVSWQQVIVYTSPLLFFLAIFIFACSLIMYVSIVINFFDKSRTAQQVVSLLYFLIGYLPSLLINASTPIGSMKFSCIWSPMAIKFALRAVFDAELDKSGISFNNLSGGANTAVPFSFCVSMMVLDAVWMALLAMYLEQIVPEHILLSSHEVDESVNAEFEERVSAEVAAQEAVRIRELRKEFTKSAGSPLSAICPKKDAEASTVAVESLNLTLYSGQITALLGHNGAGKSTTISMLTGLIAPTSGQVSVFGQDLNDVRNTFGVCPQHDILFDSLTVREHLEFYGALKGVPHEQLQHSINVKLNEVGLVEKAEALASTLSGGQKRKLSVCIALIGDSKVVFLDEPTSGMDPVSRRLIWTLLQSYRRDRVIVLTTHFMDEADLLADRIAIMSKGRLKCCGSSLFLKQRFGLGYNLVVEKADASTVEQSHNGMLIGGACNEKALTALIHQSIHGSKLLTNAAREVSYMLPLSQVHEFAALLEQLENGVCGVKQYGISLTTLEEVFLRIAAEEAVDEQDQNSTELESPFLSTSAPSYQSIHLDSGVDALIDDLPPTQRAPWHLQLKSMAMKRILMLKRDWRAIFWMVVFPVYCLVWLFVSLSFVASTDHITPPELPLSFIAELNYANSPFELTVSTLVDSQSAAAAAVTFSSFTPFNPVTLINTTRTATTELYGVLLDQTFTSYVSLAVNQLSTSMTGDLTMVLNGSALHAAPIALNSILNAVGRAANVPGSISFVNAPLPYRADFDPRSIATMIAVPLLLGLSFAYVSTGFAAQIVREKECHAKHQQFVMGVRPVVYWTANLVLDSCIYTIPVTLFFILFAAFKYTTIIGPNFVAAALTFVGAIFATLSFNYLLSFAIDKYITAMQVGLAANALLGLIFAAGTIALQLLLSSGDSDKDYGWLGLVLPPMIPTASVYYVLYILAQLDFQRSINNTTGNTWDALQWNKAGGTILMIWVFGAVYWSLVILLDSGYLSDWVRKWRGDEDTPDADVLVEDDDVIVERQRAETQQDTVSMRSIRKVFDVSDGVRVCSSEPSQKKIAVRNLTLGVGDGVCFGLLGPNGAGKSTAMAVLTGDVRATRGDAIINHSSVSSDLDSVYAKLGYCPQADGLIDLLTGRETLTMYAELKGIDPTLIPQLVERFLDAFTLRPHADKQTEQYSGGNKRKLSLAVALIGAPKVVLLDEPSTGVDPVSRRAMWSIISGAKKNRAVVLTTHALEEADVLCDRIGIMVNGALQCLGTSQHLKSKFGVGYMLEIHVDSPEDVDVVHQFVLNKLTRQAQLQENFGGRAVFALPKGHFKLPAAFKLISDAKQTLKLRDFSLSQTTLEQVFIAFAKKQVNAEN